MALNHKAGGSNPPRFNKGDKMEGMLYEFKEVESVPLYDEEKETYELMIDGELVAIGAKLFHKLFKEKTPETIFSRQQESWPEEISDGYEDIKTGIQMWMAGGYGLEDIKKMIKSYHQALPEPVLEVMNVVIEKIFEEESERR